MPRFKLTPEQAEICEPYFKIARANHEAGETGMIVAQILNLNSGYVVCEFDFIDRERVDKILKIIRRESESPK